MAGRDRFVVAAIAALALVALSRPALARKPESDEFPLEGKSVPVKLRAGERTEEKGRSDDLQETVTFDKGTLRFTELGKLGLPPSSYSVKKKGDAWIIVVGTKKDVLHVDSDLRGRWFSGAIVWKKPDAKEVNWTFHEEVLEKKK